MTKVTEDTKKLNVKDLPEGIEENAPE